MNYLQSLVKAVKQLWSTNRSSTQPARITMIAISMMMVLSLFTMFSPATSRGYIVNPRWSLGETLVYCYQSGVSTTAQSTFGSAFSAIDAQANALTFVKGACSNADVIVRNQTLPSGTPMRWTFTGSGSSGQDYIGIRSGQTFFWGVGTSTCVNLSGSQCPPVAYTTAMHEILHFLGFEHFSGSCSSGWFMYQTTSACNYSGEQVMYNQAGDGYRRPLGPDDIAGINVYYDW